jgi:hypothetical protein
MKEHPIIFSTPMVKSIMEGRKTQTRRIVKPQPDDSGLWNDDKFPRFVDSDLEGWNGTVEETGESKQFKCPYGQPGDLLWVRETFQHTRVLNLHPTDENYGYVYKADGQPWKDYEGWTWRPSIYMPKAATRIWLQVKEIRVERLQEISEENAKSEGILPLLASSMQLSTQGQLYFDYSKPKQFFNEGLPPFWSFNSLWCSINGHENWDSNPWVWVVEFEVVITTGKPEPATCNLQTETV